MPRPRVLAVLSLLALLAACAQPQAFDRFGNPLQHQAGGDIGTNTVLGSAGGAVVGGLLGRSLGGRDGRGTRTTLGAIGGAAIGGILGNQFEPPRPPVPQQGWGHAPDWSQQPGWGQPQGWGATPPASWQGQGQGWGQPPLGQGFVPQRGGW